MRFGDKVRTDDGTVYRYMGVDATLNLGTQDYSNYGFWKPLSETNLITDSVAYAALNEGHDTITDFATGAGGDVLALGDLLTGFEPGSEADFVQLMDDGADSRVAVDADGGVGGASFTPIVTLGGVTCTDLETLISEGNLETA